MSIKEEWVAALNDAIDALTWKRFLLLALLCVLGIVSMVLYDSRTTIVNYLFDTTPVERQTHPWDISEGTKQQLTKFAATRNIGAVLLTEVHLEKNKSSIKFWHTNDPIFKQELISVLATTVPRAFLDYDTTHNTQMLALLDSKFICTPSQETAFVRILPNIQKSHPTICRIAIPPFRGKFAGIFTIMLTQVPSRSDMDSLKIEITQISIEMYLRDLQKAQRAER